MRSETRHEGSPRRRTIGGLGRTIARRVAPPFLALGAAIPACGARTGLASAGGGDAATAFSLPESGSSALDAGTIGSSVDGSSPTETSAIVLNECGPADGSAITFIISPMPLQCPPVGCQRGMCPPDPAPPTRDVLSLYGNLPAGPATISFATSGPSGSGEATSCHASACVPATRVEIVLKTFSPSGGSAQGSYRLQLADGSVASGTFVAPICQNTVLCG